MPPTDTLTLILILPILATVIALLRQIVGIRAFGLYTPLIFTYALIMTGLGEGLLLFVTVLLAGTLARIAIRPLRLLYLPRLAVVFSIIAFVLAGLVWLNDQAIIKADLLVPGSILSMLIIIILVEKFVATQIDKGTQTAITLTIQTLILSIIAYFVANWSWLVELIKNQPGWLVLTVVINVLVGSWTGLRASEYLRFREVIRHAENSKE